MPDLREYAAAIVTDALRDVFPAGAPAELTDRAQNFIAVAETRAVPLEELILWIHTDAPHKNWSLAEFRRYADLAAANRAHA